MAESRGWPGSDSMLLLQCVLMGRAKEACSALSAANSEECLTVKTAMFRAYELVPEAYCQIFRTSRRGDRQSNVDFSHELMTYSLVFCL